jgi:hypothetical protein
VFGKRIMNGRPDTRTLSGPIEDELSNPSRARDVLFWNANLRARETH